MIEFLIVLCIFFAASSTTAGLISERDPAFIDKEIIIKTVNGLLITVFASIGTFINPTVSSFFLCIGLLLAAIGDYFLTKNKKTNTQSSFVIGMGLYLISYFTFGITLAINTGTLAGLLLSLIITISISILQFTSYDKTKIKGLELPIVAYLAQASLLLAVAINMNLYTWFTELTPIIVGIGLLSFYVSDSLIGQKLFNRTFKYSELYIIPTYWLGIFGVVYYILRG